MSEQWSRGNMGTRHSEVGVVNDLKIKTESIEIAPSVNFGIQLIFNTTSFNKMYGICDIICLNLNV